MSVYDKFVLGFAFDPIGKSVFFKKHYKDRHNYNKSESENSGNGNNNQKQISNLQKKSLIQTSNNLYNNHSNVLQTKYNDYILNGIGGPVEEGEGISECMTREFFDATNTIILPQEWIMIGKLDKNRKNHTSLSRISFDFPQDFYESEVYLFTCLASFTSTSILKKNNIEKIKWDDLDNYKNSLAPFVLDILNNIKPD